MRECFEITKNGSSFCFCEITICGCGVGAEESENFLRMLSMGREWIEGFLESFEPDAEEAERIARTRIAPYRFLLSISSSDICDELSFVSVESSFASRLFGGKHRKRALGLIYCIPARLFLPPSFLLFGGISSKRKRELGAPISFGLDKDEIVLVCENGKISERADDFCKRYKTEIKNAFKFDKKTLDKNKII